MNRIVWILLLCSIAVFAQTPHRKKGQVIRKKDIAAIVEGQVILKREVFELLAIRHKAQVDLIVQELAIRRIITRESRREKLTIKSDIIQEKTTKNILLARKEIQKKTGRKWQEFLKYLGMTEKEYRQQEYKKWKYNLAMQRLVRLWQYRNQKIAARHILVKTRKKAEGIRKKLQRNADFVALAKKESISKAKGGKLPAIYRGDLPELEKTIFSLKPGEISEVTKSPWGFHIIQVMKIYPGEPETTWQQAKKEILQSLEKQPVTPKEIQRWLKIMEKEYKIKFLY